MNDFFDQETGNDFDGDVPMTNRPNGASVLVNGSYQNLEVGAPFLQSVQAVALQAGFGKFKVWLNGVEVRPSSAPDVVSAEDSVEIRPFDEAG
jgi:hypothetical protein